MANAGDLLNISQDDLPYSLVSVFLTRFVAEQVKNENDLFKYIKLTVTEYAGGSNSVKKIPYQM